jgi:tetratricopeptide (TPR) repeat protein
MSRPLCFVLMPFGKKLDATGMMIDFDAVHHDVIVPAIEEAGLEAVRAEEEITGGILHNPMFERLTLCEYAIADLTTANANVFYELGLRHAARPWGTILVFAEGGRLPFDVTALQAQPYQLTPDGKPTALLETRATLVQRLRETIKAATADPRAITDSPIYQLVESFTDINHTKTDVFRDRVRYSTELKNRLALARRQGVEAVRTFEEECGTLNSSESGVVIDLFLSYRAVKAWDDMIALEKKMARPLAATIMVQEQLALALNRIGKREEAEHVLTTLLRRRGPSSETCSILGRVYKDRWEEAAQHGDTILARELLDKAIDTYLRGFETDWRDAYPGVNAVILMELKDPPDPRRTQLIPVVSYAAERRIATATADYWDYASQLELAILARDEQKAKAALTAALALVRETWEPETTARDVRLLRQARARLHESLSWLQEVEHALEQHVKSLA